MTTNYLKHAINQEALDTMDAVSAHVKHMKIKRQDGPITEAAAFCVVPTAFVSSGTIFTAYAYIYENNRHNTFIYTDLAAAANMFIGAVDRLKLNLEINAWIYLGPIEESASSG